MLTTDTRQAERRRCYVGAVALNNSAVTLLERGCYHQALEVLEDAVVAIREVMVSAKKAALPPAHDPEDSSPCGSLQVWMGSSSFPPREGIDLEEMLHVASRYVIESGQLSTGSLALDSQDLDVEMPQLKTGDDLFPSMETTTLIRLDAPQCQDFGPTVGSVDSDGDTTMSEDRNDFDAALPHLEAITILHNYAVAARFHPLSEQQLRRGAIHVTHFAFCHICRLLIPKPRSGGGRATIASTGPFEDVAFLQLSLLLTRCAYQLYVELGDLWGSGRSLSQYRLVLQAMDTDEVRHAHRLVGLSVPHAKAA